MDNQLAHTPTQAPEASWTGDRSPASVYLASLSRGSRRAQGGALNTLARILTNGDTGPAELPWHLLTYGQTQALRSRLAEQYAPSTANRILAALKGALKQAWKLGLMNSEAYRSVSDIKTIRGHREPAWPWTWRTTIPRRASSVCWARGERSGSSGPRTGRRMRWMIGSSIGGFSRVHCSTLSSRARSSGAGYPSKHATWG
jgi:hypothetical protein